MQRPLQCKKSAAAARCTFVAIRQPGLPITMIIILTITFSIATNIIIITVITAVCTLVAQSQAGLTAGTRGTYSPPQLKAQVTSTLPESNFKSRLKR